MAKVRSVTRQKIANRNKRSLHAEQDIAYGDSSRKYHVPPPPETSDVCPFCELAASMWPTRRRFREHVLKRLCKTNVTEVDFQVFLDPEDQTKEKKIAR